MQHHLVTGPELALIASTRGMMGAGVGLLLAARMNPDQRRAAGLALLFVGIVTTVPLALEVFRRKNSSRIGPLATRPD